MSFSLIALFTYFIHLKFLNILFDRSTWKLMSHISGKNEWKIKIFMVYVKWWQ